MFDGFLANAKAWWDHPFKEDGSVIDWFLFLGLILIIAWLWSRVIVRITGQ